MIARKGELRVKPPPSQEQLAASATKSNDQTTLAVLDNEDVACELSDFIDLSNAPGLLAKLNFVFEFFRCKNLYSKSDIKHLFSSKGIELPRAESPSPL